MKCAKCGHEVDPSSPNCPYCAAGASREKRSFLKNAMEGRCPCCGSERIEHIPAWWWQKTDTDKRLLKPLRLAGRLVLQILKITPYQSVCLDCNHQWKEPPRRGWKLLLMILFLVVLLPFALLCGIIHLLQRTIK